METFQEEINKKMKEGGFTIIELIVAVSLFTLVVGSTTGMFVAGIRTQTMVLATQKLLDETSYVMEYMSRTLRMAKKDDTGYCLTTSGVGYNYEDPPGALLRFINYHEICHEFDYIGLDQLAERKSSDETAGNLPADATGLTSEDFRVSPTIFHLQGESELDLFQPRVTIVLTVQKYPQGKPEIKIQTTISQRNLDLR